MTANVVTAAGFVDRRRIYQLGTTIGVELGSVELLVRLLQRYGHVADVASYGRNHLVGRITCVVTSGTGCPTIGSLGSLEYVCINHVGTATAGVILKPGTGVVAETSESEGRYNLSRYRRITVACVTIAGRFEGTAFGVMEVAAEAVLGRMRNFSYAGFVVLGLGMAYLAETTVVHGIDHPG